MLIRSRVQITDYYKDNADVDENLTIFRYICIAFFYK